MDMHQVENLTQKIKFTRMKTNNLRNKLLSLLKKEEIYLLELPNMLPEIKGEYSICVPSKEGLNPNVLMLHGVTQEFVSVLNELLGEQLIAYQDKNIMDVLFEGKPMYDMEIASKKTIKTKKECWLPVSLTLV